MPDNRNTWFLAFILLALGAVALLGNSFPVILVLLGLLFLVRQFDNENANSNLSSTRRPMSTVNMTMTRRKKKSTTTTRFFISSRPAPNSGCTVMPWNR